MLDGVEGSTTVPVLDGVEGMTYRTGKYTTKSTMRHKLTMVLPNPSMCELDLRHLQIHLPHLGFQSSNRRNKGRRRRRRDAGKSRHRARRHCRCRAPPLCCCARSRHRYGSKKGTSSIWGKWRVWILAVSAELNKGPEASGRWPKFSRRFFATQPELAPSPPPASARTPRPQNSSRRGWLWGNA
jgi:hypothetical protein